MGWYTTKSVTGSILAGLLCSGALLGAARRPGPHAPARLSVRLSEWKVVWKHCLRNAAIAPLTYFGIIASVLMTGSVVIESVFSWPGTGLLVVDAVRARDFQVVQAVVIIFAGIFIFTNLLVDVLYAYLDPRIRYQ